MEEVKHPSVKPEVVPPPKFPFLFHTGWHSFGAREGVFVTNGSAQAQEWLLLMFWGLLRCRGLNKDWSLWFFFFPRPNLVLKEVTGEWTQSFAGGLVKWEQANKGGRLEKRVSISAWYTCPLALREVPSMDQDESSHCEHRCSCLPTLWAVGEAVSGSTCSALRGRWFQLPYYLRSHDSC